MGIVSFLVFGLLAGLVARLVTPGRQAIGCLATIAVGMVGALIGGVIGQVVLGHKVHASWNLGLVLEKQGRLVQAVVAMQVCVEFEQEIGHPDAQKHAARLEQLRQRLADGDSGPVAGEGAEG